MARDPEKYRAYMVCWREQNRQRIQYSSKAYRYGVSVEEIKALELVQAGRCACCEELPSPHAKDKRKRTLVIDHDHLTGKVRALLCYHCNLALGYLRDSSTRAEQAVAYLRRFER